MDMLQWIIEEGIARKCSDYKMVERFFLANFAAIHTTSTVRPLVSLLPLPARPQDYTLPH